MLGYVKHELSDVQAKFRKGRETRDPIANIRWIIDKARESRKKSTSPLSTNAKVFDCVDHNKLWKILRDENIRPPYMPPEKSVCRSGSNS